MDSANLAVTVSYDDGPRVTLDVKNLGNARAAVRIVDACTRQSVTQTIAPARSWSGTGR
jgi:hypothetical protein